MQNSILIQCHVIKKQCEEIRKMEKLKRAKFYALQLVISHKIVFLSQLQSEFEKDPDSFKLLLKSIGMNNKAISTLISKFSGSCVFA